MKGLILKDYYMITKYCRAFVFIIAVFIVVSYFSSDHIFFIIYPALFAGMIPVTLISYDEREKWNIYSETLPYSRAQFVSAKYLIGLIFELVVLLLTATAQAFRMNKSGAFDVTEYMSIMFIVFIIGIVSPAILLPFIFKFGAEKGRIAYYIVLIIACASTTVIMNSGFLNPDKLNSTWTMAVFCIIAMIMYAISWGISILAYKKREL